MKHTYLTPLEYPKLLCFLGSCILAYVLFRTGAFDVWAASVNGYGYVSIFIAGLLFSFGFTSPFAIAMFIEMARDTHPFLGAIVGGAGALVADLGIFEFTRFSLADELHRMGRMPVISAIKAFFFHKRFPEKLRTYCLWSFAGLVIASPLPDEIGVSLLSGVTQINTRSFALLCFLFNSAGIFVILAGAKLLS